MSMNPQDKVTIQKLPTGVPGLDEIVGGGLPEFSFNIIAGAPGSGNTTLAHQFMFANATPERPALYFTVLGEPAIKMARYQQQRRPAFRCKELILPFANANVRRFSFRLLYLSLRNKGHHRGPGGIVPRSSISLRLISSRSRSVKLGCVGGWHG